MQIAVNMNQSGGVPTYLTLINIEGILTILAQAHIVRLYLSVLNIVPDLILLVQRRLSGVEPAIHDVILGILQLGQTGVVPGGLSSEYIDPCIFILYQTGKAQILITFPDDVGLSIQVQQCGNCRENAVDVIFSIPKLMKLLGIGEVGILRRQNGIIILAHIHCPKGGLIRLIANTLQSSALIKCSIANQLQSLRQIHRLQVSAVDKSIIADLRHIFRNTNLGQGLALIEG